MLNSRGIYFLGGAADGIPLGLLGCPRKLGSLVRINGLLHLLINGVLLGGITH